MPWQSIWLLTILSKFSIEHLSLLVERFVLRVIFVRNKDKSWFNDACMLCSTSSRNIIFGGFVISLEVTGMSLSVPEEGLIKKQKRSDECILSS